jgi:hypothetical protein
MLRSIAEIARNEGEDPSDPESALSCIQVFALGGRAGSADASESVGGPSKALIFRLYDIFPIGSFEPPIAHGAYVVDRVDMTTVTRYLIVLDRLAELP